MLLRTWRLYCVNLLLIVGGLFSTVSRYYKLCGVSAYNPEVLLPSAPCNQEKYRYIKRHINVLTLFTVIGFVCTTIAATGLVLERPRLFPLTFLLSFSILYFITSLMLNLFPVDFDLKKHQILITQWRPTPYPSVDVFLPTCGEPISILQNTWDGVVKMQSAYLGLVNIYCLDDAHSQEVKQLADRYKFHYHARPNRGWFKKAGNLRHGFENSSGEFIAIFDADFIPRHDFLNELLPYFYNDDKLGIVQSPQYFEVSDKQNWLERGAGAVQEFFYRAVQISRQTHEGAVCVGSNAIYRRKALQEIGGTVLIEHSEDMHTGFQLRRKDWHLLYIPVILAKGLCPSELPGFFKQQYRWCMGSLYLIFSRDFWSTKLPLMTRLCYTCGPMYYLHTAIYVIFTPVVPLMLLLALPQEIKLFNYALLLPSIFYLHAIFPFWHKSKYGIETASVKLVQNWAHLFAIVDHIFNATMEWHPTGTTHKKAGRYNEFRIGVIIFNLIPAIIWILVAYWYVWTWGLWDFLPILVFGIYYFLIVIKVVLEMAEVAP